MRSKKTRLLIVKQGLIIFTLALISTSCISYVQVFETKSNIEKKGDRYVSEDGIMKIEYYFWKNEGVLSFSITNKKEVPIYVDWSRSSFISELATLEYHNKNCNPELKKFYYSDDDKSPGFEIKEEIDQLNTNRELNNKITFIPPKSTIYKSVFNILPIDYFKLSEDIQASEETQNSNPNKTVKVYKETYKKNKSPLIFRNFITFSFDKEFEEEFYLDHEFYVNSISEMNKGHFIGERTKNEESGEYLNAYPFKKGTDFYLYINKINSVEQRSLFKE